MTTEGDGNYGLQRFLEAEGAEPDIQLVDRVAALHDLAGPLRHGAARDLARATKGEGGPRRRKSADVRRALADRCRPARRCSAACSGRSRSAMGLYDYHLPDMDEIADDLATSTTTTTSAAAKATWRSAS